MNQQTILLSVIMPIFNEEGILEESLQAFAEQFDTLVGNDSWQFVLVENGSSDDSPRIVRDFAQRRPLTRTLFLERPNYGNALREGILAAEGRWSLIMNVDHLWDTPFFAWAWDHREEYDLVLGSKRADPTLNEQGFYRRLLSAGLNSLLQYLFDFVGADSHGIKLMRQEPLRPIAEACVMRRGQFDTELTFRALRRGLWVAEVPVPYLEKRRPRNLMVKKIGQNVLDLFRFRAIMRDVPVHSPVRYRRFCREDLDANGQ